MHLAQLRLRDFRNYTRLDAAFAPGFHLFLGDNAQGKTNILEAIYLLATLRSFRGVGGGQMIRHGQKGYFVGATTVGTGTHEIKIYWSPRERKLSLNGQPVKKLTDYFGVLRVVVFCAEDLPIVKGPAQRRRRFMDLLLAQTMPKYLPVLQRYTQALRARNALLKARTPDPRALESFTRELVQAGEQIISLRKRLCPRLAELAAASHARIVGGQETLGLEYRPSVAHDLAVALANSRDRERTLRSTVVGPHRDDLALMIENRPAAQFGSEGQKRSIALALKMAQAELLAKVHGVPPILLIDDVMGELDAKRRAGLLPLLERTHAADSQVFMTCTEENWPRELGRRIHRWRIDSGTLTPMKTPAIG